MNYNACKKFDAHKRHIHLTFICLWEQTVQCSEKKAKLKETRIWEAKKFALLKYMWTSWEVQIESQLFLRKLLTQFAASHVFLPNLFKDSGRLRHTIKRQISFKSLLKDLVEIYLSWNSNLSRRCDISETCYLRLLVKFKLSDLIQLFWQIWTFWQNVFIHIYNFEHTANHWIGFQCDEFLLQANRHAKGTQYPW